MKFNILFPFFPKGYRKGNRIHYGIKRNDHFEKDSTEESDGSESEEE